MSAKLSISVNEKAIGFFSSSRGVWQGDPLSPLLFCIVEEAFSCNYFFFADLVQKGKLLHMVSSKRHFSPS